MQLTKILPEAANHEMVANFANTVEIPANAGTEQILDEDAQHEAQTQVLRNQMQEAIKAVGKHAAMAESRLVVVQSTSTEGNA